MGTLVVGLILAGIVGGIIMKMVRDKKSGKNCSGCSSCSMCGGSCHNRGVPFKKAHSIRVKL